MKSVSLSEGVNSPWAIPPYFRSADALQLTSTDKVPAVSVGHCLAKFRSKFSHAELSLSGVSHDGPVNYALDPVSLFPRWPRCRLR